MFRTQKINRRMKNETQKTSDLAPSCSDDFQRFFRLQKGT
jgi:hypothetical protein